jgi:hypothetical protein
MTDETQTPVVRAKRPYDPTNNKGRGYGFLWAVYPDYWAKTWGPRPCLGFVRADTEFDAKYAAYDKGLLPVNNTFGPEVHLQKPKPFRST